MDFNVYNRYLHDPLINVYGFLNVIMNIGFFYFQIKSVFLPQLRTYQLGNEKQVICFENNIYDSMYNSENVVELFEYSKNVCFV